MAAQLVIYLKDISSLDADWVFTGQDNEITTPVSSGTIAELAEKNKNNILSAQLITCIINAELIHFSYQNIPAKNKQRALQAIPFALEEQLAEDIELLHFATSSAENNIYPVAAIKHELLQNLLNKLKEHDIRPDFIYPDISCLPQTKNSWNVLKHEDRISIDQHHDSIVHTDTDSFSIILNKLIQQADESQQPDSISIWSDDDLPDLTLLEDINIINHDYKISPVSIFLQNLKQKHLINLLQGTYKVVSQSSQWWKVWRVAAAMASVVIVLKLISGGIELNRLEAENKQINSEITRIYKKSFPLSKRVINARVQMENKLKKLRNNNTKGSASFTDLLASASPVIQQTAGINMQAINFSNKKLELLFTIDKLSSAESFKTRLNKLHDIKAELVSTSSDSKLVSAKIKIEAL